MADGVVADLGDELKHGDRSMRQSANGGARHHGRQGDLFLLNL